MSDSIPLDPDRLLEHVAWVRRLAGRLIQDPATADDAAQDSLFVALEKGPRDAARPRPWLAAVVRSVVRRMRRSEERRDARERVAARPEALPATDDLVQRAELLRAVVGQVIALPEPYRSTILLRFFEERSAQEIAARRGEPVETIRTRLKRGLAMLRAELARELDVETGEGTRRHGLEALLLLVEPARTGSVAAAGAAATTSAGAVITGGSLMASMAKGSVLIAVIAATALTTWSLTKRQGETPVKADESAIRSAAPASSGSVTASREAVALAPEPPHELDSKDSPQVTKEAAPAIDPRLSALTKENWQQLMREDDGPRIRGFVAGLESESIDLLDLTQYLEETLRDAFIVPDAGKLTSSSDGRETAEAIACHLNSKGEPSVWLPVWGGSKDDEHANVLIPIPFWGREHASQVDIPSNRLSPWFTVFVHRTKNGQMSGGVLFNAGVSGSSEGGMRELEANDAKLKRLEQQGLLPSNLTFHFTGTTGRLTWSRSGAGQELSTLECERLSALFDRVKRLCQDNAKTSSK